jgi:hypothetical protein
LALGPLRYGEQKRKTCDLADQTHFVLSFSFLRVAQENAFYDVWNQIDLSHSSWIPVT